MTRVAVVTGAARGIGAATARALARDGWTLVLGDVCADDPALDYPLATRAELDAVAADSGAAVALRCDVRKANDVDALVAAAAEHGDVQAAVAVAGILGGSGVAWQLDDRTIERDLDVNFRGVVHLARSAVPHLLRNAGLGRFVAVTSAAGADGLPLLASYSAAKHAAMGFVRSLAADLAPMEVTANAVLPGSTDTPLLAATAHAYGLASPEEFGRHQRTGRLVRPEEVAAVIAWLVSPGASGVTGAAVPVDGAFTG